MSKCTIWRIGAVSAAVLLGFMTLCAVDRANAQVSDHVIKIGVLGDQSGVVADIGGPGSVIAARMAVADAGAKAAGAPVEIVVGDHQNKPDVATAIAQRWFDVEGVDAVVDLPHTGVVLALRNIADAKKRILMVSGAASAQITGKSCSRYVTHWTDDTYALANGTARATRPASPDCSLREGGVTAWLSSRRMAACRAARNGRDLLIVIPGVLALVRGFAVSMRAVDDANDFGIAGMGLVAKPPFGKPDRLGCGQHGGLGRQEQAPFLMCVGQGFAAGACERPTSVLDIAPTVLQHLGLEFDGLDGRALQDDVSAKLAL